MLCARGLEGPPSSQLTPAALRCIIRELQKLELVHARSTAFMQSDSGTVVCILQSYGDRAFPEFRRLGGD